MHALYKTIQMYAKHRLYYTKLQIVLCYITDKTMCTRTQVTLSHTLYNINLYHLGL